MVAIDELANPEDIRVLVVVVNNLRDWDIACTEGWYRIPLNRAPKRIGADYLAFYFTRAFGEEAWAVRYAAPVSGIYVASRADLLPDEPDHPRAADLYYRVKIGPVEALPRPVPSQRLRRLAFLPTTMDRLLRAEEINDLWIREPLEERLWEVLREEGMEPEGSLEVREGRVTYLIPIAIPCTRGGISVSMLGPFEVPDGWTHIAAQPALEVGDWAELVVAVKQGIAERGGAQTQPLCCYDNLPTDSGQGGKR